jgi:hypothetical protein
VPDACVDCRTLKFTSGFSETFRARGFDGSAFLVTLRLCLDCGARFADRAQMRDYLSTRLPAHAVETAAAAVH